MSKSFRPEGSSNATHRVLDGLTLSMEENEFVTVLGPSGCGKTTLLRLVAGLERPDGGRLVFDGRPIAAPGADRVVVFQQTSLYPWLNVRKNVAFGLRLANRKIDWQAVDSTIAIVGLQGFEDRKPYELSGGMQQRVALARALVMEPRMLLLDEPFAALDAHMRRAMQEFLLDLWQRVKTTVLFITHDVDEAALLADRVLVMRSAPGRIAGQIPVEIPRPRSEKTLEEPVFRELRGEAMSMLRGAPDAEKTTISSRG